MGRCSSQEANYKPKLIRSKTVLMETSGTVCFDRQLSNGGK